MISIESLQKQYAHTIPVPIVSIANDLGLAIWETADFPDGTSGMIRKEQEQIAVYINITDPAERKRFTIAHAIGHLLLHSTTLDKGETFIETSKQYILTPKHQKTSEKAEYEATKFALSFLMPEEEFTHTWEKAKTIEEIAEQFNVSSSVAALRAHELFHVFII